MNYLKSKYLPDQSGFYDVYQVKCQKAFDAIENLGLYYERNSLPCRQ